MWAVENFIAKRASEEQMNLLFRANAGNKGQFPFIAKRASEEQMNLLFRASAGNKRQLLLFLRQPLFMLPPFNPYHIDI